MSRVFVVVGFGPGVSTAVAEKFGAEGFSVALVGRSEDRLAAGVQALKAKGIGAVAVPGDAADPTAIRGAIAKARAELGPLTVIHWNAYGGAEAGDFVTGDPAAVKDIFDIGVVGLLSAVQEALPDLKTADGGAVLVTNGAFGAMAPAMDALAVQMNVMGVALANAAKAKLVGLLAVRLKDDGVYVGEVTIAGAVKGTAWAGEDGIEGSKIADTFWRLYQARDENRAMVS
jgi:NADP-dependent 3-hydroxy acid dehydrogenase YdfG